MPYSLKDAGTHSTLAAASCLLFLVAAAYATENPATMQVRRIAATVTEITATFDVSPARLFAALTEPEKLPQWMSATGFALDSVAVDPRVGGGFRYVYRRPGGKTIEVRGSYRRFDPPRGYAYVETYDFSPLTIDVEVRLEGTGSGARYTQTLRYSTEAERDEDYDGVATSSREALVKLATYLATGEPPSR